MCIRDRDSQSSYLQLSTSGSDAQVFSGAGALKFKTGSSEAARFDTSGNFGINNSAPTTPLEVNGVVRVNEAPGVSNGTIIIDALATGNPNLAFQQAGTYKGYIHYLDSSDTICLNDGSGNGLHYSPTLKRLGIDTNAPSQALDVVGNAEINGNIYNNGKLNIRKDGASEREHLVITNEQGGSNSSPTYRDIHFNGYSGKDRGRITVQDRSNNKVGGFMELQTARSETTDGSGLKTSIFLDNDGDIFFYEDTGTTAKVAWNATNERFGIGTTVPSTTLDVAGDTTITKNDTPLYLNRTGSDGEVLRVSKDGTQIGYLGNISAEFSVTNATATNGAGICLQNNLFVTPMKGGSKDSSSAISLGNTSFQWKDIYLGGGAYIGGTGTANKLDDYEEGTFTPTFKINNSTAGISATQVGAYTKIGNLVTLQIFIELSNKGSSTGFATISGIPFTIATLTSSWSGVGTGPMVWNNMASALVQAGVVVNRSSQILTLIGHTASSGNATAQQLNNNNFNNNSYMGITVSYLST